MFPEQNYTSLGQRRILTTTASDIGIFSGKEKKRLELSNDELDPTHKLAVAIFDDKANPEGKEYKDWVYVMGPGDKQVKAEVSSLAKRLDLAGLKGGKGKVIELAMNRCLDKEIQMYVRQYEKEARSVKEFINTIKTQSQGIKEDEYWKINKPFADFVQDANYNFRHDSKNVTFITLLNEFFEDAYPCMDIKKFNEKFEKFETKLAKLDPNFSPNVEIPREKVTEDTKFGYKNLKKPPLNLLTDCVAVKVTNSDASTGESAVRFNFSPEGHDGNRFAIKTDGYIYHSKPKATDKFVPYTQDGQSWILLNLDSLHYRTGVSKEAIKEAVNSPDKKALDKLINTEKFYHERAAYESKYLEDHPEILADITAKEEQESQKRELDDAVESFRKYAGSDNSTLGGKRRFNYESKLVAYKDFDSLLKGFKALSQADLVKELTSDGLTWELRTVSLEPHAPLLQRLIEERGDEAVRFAAKQGNWAAFDTLVGHLVDLKKDLNTVDEDGNTLLHIALINERDKSIQRIGTRVRMDSEDFIPTSMDIPNKAGETANDLFKKSKYAANWWWF